MKTLGIVILIIVLIALFSWIAFYGGYQYGIEYIQNRDSEVREQAIEWLKDGRKTHQRVVDHPEWYYLDIIGGVEFHQGWVDKYTVIILYLQSIDEE